MDLRVLFIEDNADDMELMLRRLRDAELTPQWRRVESEAGLVAALEDDWDVALVDYNLPGFGGPQALRVLAEQAPDVPAVTVSGAIDENTAVATITAGAVDYVLKDNLTRLAPAVRRAVDGADLRRAHRRAAESARLALYALDHAAMLIVTVAEDGSLVYVNRFTCEHFGVAHDQMVGRKLWDVTDLSDAGEWALLWGAAGGEGVVERRVDSRGAGGARRLFEVSADYLEDAGVVIAYGRDVTRRVRAEEEVREREEHFRLLAEHVPGYVSIKDAQGRYVYPSSTRHSLDSVGDGAWLGKLPQEVWPPEEARRSFEMVERVVAGETVDEVTKMVRDDRVRYHHELHFPIPGGNGSPLVAGLLIDSTELFEAQEELRGHAERLRRTVEGAVLAMSQVVETRDPYTAGHERRVAELAVAIGEEMGLDEEAVEGMRLAGMIHDIGKISVPAEILAKPGRLSAVEFSLIQQHVIAGYEILGPIEFGRPVADIVLQHHERLDGSGYPNGTAGDDLLLEARILAVADVVEAMSSHRPYRASLGMDKALAEIGDGRGVRYDAAVADACVALVEQGGFSFTP